MNFEYSSTRTLKPLIKETFQNFYMKDASLLMLLEKKLYRTVDNGSVNFKFKNIGSYSTQMKQTKKESLKTQKEGSLG